MNVLAWSISLITIADWRSGLEEMLNSETSPLIYNYSLHLFLFVTDTCEEKLAYKCNGIKTFIKTWELNMNCNFMENEETKKLVSQVYSILWVVCHACQKS